MEHAELDTGKYKSPATTLRGVGGWLILPIIGFVGVIILTAINLSAAFGQIEGLKLIFTGSDPNLHQLRLPVALSVFFGIAVMASAATCLYRIFVSRQNVRKFAVTHYVLLALAGIAEFWGDGVITAAIPGTPSDPAATKDVVRGIIAAAIWIPYFMASKRVANTFESSTAKLDA